MQAEKRLTFFVLRQSDMAAVSYCVEGESEC